MFNIGETVTIKVLNPLWHARERYANGYIGPKYNEYTGTIMREKWFDADEIGITSDVPGLKFRRIHRSRIVEVSGAKVDYTPVKSSRETITVQGSKGNTYIVTKENGKATCTCAGFQYRKTCKHVQEIV